MELNVAVYFAKSFAVLLPGVTTSTVAVAEHGAPLESILTAICQTIIGGIAIQTVWRIKLEPIQPVTIFGKFIGDFGVFKLVYLVVFGKIFNLPEQISFAIGQIFIVLNGQIVI